jgi:hypothetical protein
MRQQLNALIKDAAENAKDWMEVVTFILAIIAIVFAVVQFSDSRHLLEETSTKYIGSFPDNMDDINSLLDRSHQELLVLVDYPGYGLYSKPDKFEDYIKKIIKLRQTTPLQRVRMLIYSSRVQEMKFKQEQFEKESWEKIKADPRFKALFGTYHIEMETPKTYDSFINSILTLQAQTEKKLCNNGVEIEHIDQSSAIFFWLEDENSAVFAINNRAGANRELSFNTRDGKLIDSLQSMFNRLWEDNQSDPKGCHPPANGT